MAIRRSMSAHGTASTLGDQPVAAGQSSTATVGAPNPTLMTGPASLPSQGQPSGPKKPTGAMRALAAHQLKGGRGASANQPQLQHGAPHGSTTGAIRRPFGGY